MKIFKIMLAVTLACLIKVDVLIADNDMSVDGLQVVEQKKKYLDLIVLFDDSELITDSTRPISYLLATALSQKTAPIIASGNIVRNCCVWQRQNKQLLDKVKQAVVTDYKTAIKQSEQMCKEAKFDVFTATVLSLVDFNDWDCFKHKDNNFFLFIPKSYSDRHAEVGSNNKIKDCGFNSDQLQKINNPSVQAILDVMPAGTSKSGDEVTSLISMLVPQKKLSLVEKLNVMQVWSIYISGHGGSGSMRKKDLMDEVSNLSEQLAITEQQMSSFPASFLEDPQVKDAFAVARKGLDDKKQQLLSVQHLSEEAIVPASALIAGVPFNDFSRLLHFLENDIYTVFLHYMTCFGGGENKTFINDTLSKIQASFIVSAEGINERVNHGYAYEFNPSKDNFTLIMSSKNFVNFFNLLNAFFGDTAAFMSMQVAGKALQKDPIATILRNIVPIDALDFNQPTVRIPSVGIFSPLSVDKSVKILTNSIAKAYEFEDKTISYVDPEIKAIVLYPKQLSVPLTMKPDINIISPTQQKNAAATNLHNLKKVVCNESLLAVLHDFIFSNRTPYKTVFYIKDLECLNYQDSGLEADQHQQLMIKNMIIVLQGVEPVSIDVAFIYNNERYSYSFKINAVTMDDSLLLKALLSRQIKVNRATGKYDLIAKVVGTTDTNFEVQQPGSFKKVFFVQKLDGLEKALAPEQIEQEKTWLAKNNKSAATFTKTLNRYKTELSGLVDQINKLPEKDLNQKDRDDLLQKAATINIRIADELAPSMPVSQAKPVVVPNPIEVKKTPKVKKQSARDRAKADKAKANKAKKEQAKKNRE